MVHPTASIGTGGAGRSPHGHTLATTHIHGTVLLWDVSDPAAPQPLDVPLTGHTDVVTAVAFATDGHTLATASTDGTAILWDLTGMEWLRACAITS